MTCPHSFEPIIPPIELLKQWNQESKGKSQALKEKYLEDKYQEYYIKGSTAWHKAVKTDAILCNDKINTFLKNEMEKKLNLNEYIKNYKPESTTLQTEFSEIDNDTNNYQKTKTVENKLKAYAKRYASSSKKELYIEKDKLEKLIAQNATLSSEIEFLEWVVALVFSFDADEMPEKALEASNKLIAGQKKFAEGKEQIKRDLAIGVVTAIPAVRAGKWIFKSGKWIKGKSKAKTRPKGGKGKSKAKKKETIRSAAKARMKNLGPKFKRIGQQLTTIKKLKILFGLALACAVNYLIEEHSQNIPRPKLPNLTK